MRLFYLSMMRHAPAVLFGIALVVFVAMVYLNLWVSSNSPPISYESYDASRLNLPEIVQAVTVALNTAIWPLIAAAALWRFDGIFLGKPAAASQAETVE